MKESERDEMMEDLRCRDCKIFVEKYGGRCGGGESCSKDSFKRRKIHALDYACENVVVEPKGE